MFKFNKKTLHLLLDAGWSEDRCFLPAEGYIKELEYEDFYVSDAVKEFLYKFGGLIVKHPHAKLKEKTDYFHFDVIKALNSGDPGWVSEEYSQRIGKKLCIIGEAFRRSMILCMSPDKRVYAGIDEKLFFIDDSGESAIESLCSGNELKEIPEYFYELEEAKKIFFALYSSPLKSYASDINLKLSYNIFDTKFKNKLNCLNKKQQSQMNL